MRNRDRRQIADREKSSNVLKYLQLGEQGHHRGPAARYGPGPFVRLDRKQQAQLLFRERRCQFRVDNPRVSLRLVHRPNPPVLGQRCYQKTRMLGAFDDNNNMKVLFFALPYHGADRYLRDGGHYRFRRHSCFIQDQRSGELAAVPHRAHWQSTQYIALHGGINRLFEPIETQVSRAVAWTHLLGCIEAHQFRIDTAEGIGRPTPEGAHRDGVLR